MRPLWLFSPKKDSSLALVPDLEYPPGVVKISLQLLDADSVPDFVVESRHYYGDGFYSQLNMITSSGNSGKSDWTVIPLNGSSGEESGQTTEGSWCLDTSDSKSLLFLLRQEKEGADFKSGVYSFGPEGFGRYNRIDTVFGAALSDPASRILAEVGMHKWRTITHSNLCLLPCPGGSRWYFGKLFIGERERTRWLAQASISGLRNPTEFSIGPLGIGD